ncbi:N-acetyltransferase [Tsuneonella deserti]|uniref:N-acetyltransferase n=1 Tax=Tsuneonella deserti TaxID=2035528 RepID=A0ABQ1SA71_9SPHN|nr:GNAT family N-acetyltransferase [Tsuneonella deserti]GGD97320.1 N-acetyltransferase [Tsuneonella deserti]
MFHRTKRLFLRPAWPEDWEAVLGGIADEDVVRNLARVPWPYGPEEARAFVSRGQDLGYPSFLLIRPEDGRAIGCAGLGDRDGDAELGYWIARPFWGLGYATEAGGGVLEIARLIGHRRLSAGHFLDNPASGRVLRKLGFVATGKVCPRFSCARGSEAVAAEYSIDLDAASVAPTQAAA